MVKCRGRGEGMLTPRGHISPCGSVLLIHLLIILRPSTLPDEHRRVHRTQPACLTRPLQRSLMDFSLLAKSFTMRSFLEQRNALNLSLCCSTKPCERIYRKRQEYPDIKDENNGKIPVLLFSHRASLSVYHFLTVYLSTLIC